MGRSLIIKLVTVILAIIILLNPSISVQADTADAEKPNAAVLDFNYKNVSKDDAETINDFFRSELSKTNKFNVLDRANIEKILKEMKLQSIGLTDTKNAVEIGKMLNVQYIFVGTFSKLDNMFMLTVNMVNIKTGKIEKTESKTTEEDKPQKKLEITTWVAYSFSGFGVGYELFWDGKRVGFMPEWTIEEASKNLEWNKKTNTQFKVEGLFNGKKMP